MTGSKLYSDADEDRWVSEPKEPHRTCFRRDYARLIHSPVFRRLQGKTQLFPNFESDFFRNRLTHSLEVAQVAKSIAQRLNKTQLEFEGQNRIDEDIVEFAGLAHDLGHPPFGHKGERALNECMKKWGGFEGNAQTIRNLRLEKKQIRHDAPDDAKGCGVSEDGRDFRAGLNLTARCLAAVLKYDELLPIPPPDGEQDATTSTRSEEHKLDKGYYQCDKELVDWIWATVLQGKHEGRKNRKTIECQIMDLADDIAYSTYDLEDAFKAGFLSPLDVLALDVPTRAKIAKKVAKAVSDDSFNAADVLNILIDCFGNILPKEPESNKLKENESDSEEVKAGKRFRRRLRDAVFAYGSSGDVSSDGYSRNATTSKLVSSAVEGVELKKYDADCPVLSEVGLKKDVHCRVEVLKRVAYHAIVQTPRLQVAEYRGAHIIKEIFDALSVGDGHLLLPADYKELYSRFERDPVGKHRLICDFIAGMTDAYAIEFYRRLKSADAHLLFKPH